MRRIYCILALLFLVGCTTVPTYVDHGIPNFRQINPGEYRGGQPTLDGWLFLRTVGVSNVIKLNLESEGSDDDARKLGMTVYYLPIDTLHQTLKKPSFLLVSNAVVLIKPGSYLHCEHGQDRTGLISACKRVWVDHWTKADARKEMLDDGFHRALHGLDDFWEDDVH